MKLVKFAHLNTMLLECQEPHHSDSTYRKRTTTGTIYQIIACFVSSRTRVYSISGTPRPGCILLSQLRRGVALHRQHSELPLPNSGLNYISRMLPMVRGLGCLQPLSVFHFAVSLLRRFVLPFGHYVLFLCVSFRFPFCRFSQVPANTLIVLNI